jgi:predicted amidophosphoribosyltransferase
MVMGFAREKRSRGSQEVQALVARPVRYVYRYCPRCRRKWPASHQSCQECMHSKSPLFGLFSKEEPDRPQKQPRAEAILAQG